MDLYPVRRSRQYVGPITMSVQLRRTAKGVQPDKVQCQIYLQRQESSDEVLTETDHITRVHVRVVRDLRGQLLLGVQGDLVHRERDLREPSTNGPLRAVQTGNELLRSIYDIGGVREILQLQTDTDESEPLHHIPGVRHTFFKYWNMLSQLQPLSPVTDAQRS